MAISGIYAPARYTGNGSTVAFGFAYPYFQSSDLVVTLFDTNAQAEVSPAPVLDGDATYDYTVTGLSGFSYPNNNVPEFASATVTFNNAPPANYQITIARNVPATQNLNALDNARFPASSVNAALDRGTMVTQQNAAAFASVLLFPVADPAGLNYTVPVAALRAGKYLAFDVSGNAIAVPSVGEWRGTWATATVYNQGDIVTDGAAGADTQNIYYCAVANTSGTWSTDLSAGDWVLAVNVAAVITAEDNAATSATNAASSASSASTSASTATTEAGDAATSAGAASSSASSASSSASSATSSASSASSSASAASASATAAASAAAGLTDTSSTSLTIGTGSQTATVSTGKQFAAGQFISLVSRGNTANYMHGQVTSYSGSTLVVNVLDIGGSGTHTDWNVSVSGSQGSVGPAGGTMVESTVSSGQSVGIGQALTYYVCTSPLTLTIALSTTLSKAFQIAVDAQGGAVTVTPYTTDAINGGAAGSSVIVPQGNYAILATDATGNLFLNISPDLGKTFLVASSNLSDVSNPSTARTNIGAASGAFQNALLGASASYWPFGTNGTVTAGTPALTLSKGNRALIGHIIGCTGATVAWSQVASPFATPRTPYAVKIVGQTGVTDTSLRFVISAQRAAQYAGRTCTFMMRVKTAASTSGTPTIATKYPSASDNWGSSSPDLSASNLQALTASTETLLAYTLAVSANASNGYEVIVDFGTTLGGTSYAITYGEFELRETDGATTGQATPTYAPEIPAPTEDMLDCMARFQSSYINGVAPGAADTNGMISLFGDGSQAWAHQFPVPLHAAPSSMTYYDGAGTANKDSYNNSGSYTNGVDVITPVNSSARGCLFSSAATGYQRLVHYAADADILGA